MQQAKIIYWISLNNLNFKKPIIILPYNNTLLTFILLNRFKEVVAV